MPVVSLNKNILVYEYDIDFIQDSYMFKVVEDRIIPTFLVEKLRYLNSQLNIRMHILPAENQILVVVILRVDV